MNTIAGIGVFLAGIFAAGTTGIAYKALNTSKKGLLIDELGRIRNDIYSLSKVNERARKELEFSNNKDVNRDKDLLIEIQRLRTVLNEINESQRKIALDELSSTREELLELSINNSDAGKELQNSHGRRISTEDTAREENKRLRVIIESIRNYNKKALFDDLSTLRYKLQVLSDENNDKAKTALDESFDKQLNLECEIQDELNRLHNLLTDISDQARRELELELKSIRNKLYDLSIENDLAKTELDLSYRKRLVSNKCFRNEIRRIDNVITEVKSLERKRTFGKLNNLRDDLYSKSRENSYARTNLEDSYNRRINDDIAEKEIERLEGVREQLKRDEILNGYRKRFHLV